MKFHKIVLTAILLLGTVAFQIAAAEPKPVEMAADVIEYDATTGVMTGRGGVTFTQADAVLTGANATYNTKTKEAHITGGIKLVRADTVLTAEEMRSYEDNHIVASGGIELIKGDSRLTGPQLDYYIDKAYAIVNQNARLVMPDGMMTADKMEAYMDTNQVTGTGNVHIVSETRKLDATSHQAVYYGSKEGQARAVLTGNARAVQAGNVLTGNKLTIYLDDQGKSARGGDGQLVIQPQ